MSRHQPSVAMIEQTAGKGAACVAARRRARQAHHGFGQGRRFGPVAYVVLAAVVLISAYPLYFAFLLGH